MADEKEEDNIGSFYMGRMRPPPIPKRFLPPGMVTVIALVALGGIIWYAYPHGAEKYTDVDVPVVKADTAPIKAAPTNPGGMDVPHQDSTAFDPLTKSSSAEVEKLMPAAEQPMDKAEVIKAAEHLPPVAASPSVPPKLTTPQIKDAGNGAEVIVPKAPEARPPVVAAAALPVSTPAPVATPVPPKTAVAKTVTAKAAPQKEDDTHEAYAKGVVKTAPKTAATSVSKATATKLAAVTPAAAPSSASDSKYEVQLGSYRQQADADKDWSKLTKKYASYFGKLKRRLVKADVPGKGTYYRLQAGSVSKDRAHEICDALKADKRGCILAKQ